MTNSLRSKIKTMFKNPVQSRKEEKLEKEITENMCSSKDFVVVVFYRGYFCELCTEYLRNVQKVYPSIKEMNGEVVAVCSQPKAYTQQLKEDLCLDFKVFSDTKNNLSKRYGVPITHKKETSMEKLKNVFLNLHPEYNDYFKDQLAHEESFAQSGMVQPGVLIFKRGKDGRGNLIYKWKSQIAEKNLYGSMNRLQPQDWYKILLHLFGNSDEETNKKFQSLKVKNRQKLLESILNDEKSRDAFKTQLKKEFNDELLNFITHLEDLRKLLDDKNTTRDDVISEMNTIIDLFIKSGSPQELNLSGEMRKSVEEKFEEQKKSEYYQDLTKTINEVFEQAEFHVRQILASECIQRLLLSPEIVGILERHGECFDM